MKFCKLSTQLYSAANDRKKNIDTINVVNMLKQNECKYLLQYLQYIRGHTFTLNLCKSVAISKAIMFLAKCKKLIIGVLQTIV